jgi:hypothetical protein
MANQGLAWKKGGCHCGAVRFEVLAPDEIEVQACNCSICRMTGFLHLIVPKAQFRLRAGRSHLTTYVFNTETAKHLFCSICGIKSFYVPRSHPEGYSVNFRCLNADDFRSVLTTEFDGRNWEQHISELPPLGSGN